MTTSSDMLRVKGHDGTLFGCLACVREGSPDIFQQLVPAGTNVGKMIRKWTLAARAVKKHIHEEHMKALEADEPPIVGGEESNG